MYIKYCWIVEIDGVVIARLLRENIMVEMDSTISFRLEGFNPIDFNKFHKVRFIKVDSVGSVIETIEFTNCIPIKIENSFTDSGIWVDITMFFDKQFILINNNKFNNVIDRLISEGKI